MTQPAYAGPAPLAATPIAAPVAAAPPGYAAPAIQGPYAGPVSTAPSSIDGAAQAIIAANAAAPPPPGASFASQVSVAAGMPGVDPNAYGAVPPGLPGLPQPASVIPIESHPGFQPGTHYDPHEPMFVGGPGDVADPYFGQPAPPVPLGYAYAPPAPAPGQPPIYGAAPPAYPNAVGMPMAPAPMAPGMDPGIQAMLRSNADALKGMTEAVTAMRTGAPDAGPADPGPMPNASIEPEKFQIWLTARDAKAGHDLRADLQKTMPNPDAQRAQAAEQQEFGRITDNIYSEMFQAYPGLAHVDSAALTGIVSAVADANGLNSMEALRQLAQNPQGKAQVYHSIATRLGVPQGPIVPPNPGVDPRYASPGIPAPYAYTTPPAPMVHPGVPAYTAGIAAPPGTPTYAPPAAPPMNPYAVAPNPMYAPSAYGAPPVYGAVVDRTSGMSAGSAVPAPQYAAPASFQPASMVDQLGQIQQATGIY